MTGNTGILQCFDKKHKIIILKNNAHDACVLLSWDIGVLYFRAVEAIWEINKSNLFVRKIQIFVIVNIFIRN